VSLWDVAGVSAYLRVPRSAVYKMTARSAAFRIPHLRLGGRLRFRREDIDQWLSLLATAQPDALERIRRKAHKVTHGHYP
jgi:excisionase family DNA binding protein